MQKDIFQKLISEKRNPCVTISMNSHRTHPDNVLDAILLKKLCKETEERLITEFGKRPIALLLEKLLPIPSEIDENRNLNSLHIFLSNDTKEIFRSTWPTKENKVQISDSFAVNPLIKSISKSIEYLILLLSQSGAKLFKTKNEAIVEEIEYENFPFAENTHFNTEPEKLSDAKSTDNMVREFINTVDKAIVKVHNQTKLRCVVISTEGNFSRLRQVADQPNIYLGHANIDYNHQTSHYLSAQAWEIVKELQSNREKEAIDEMKEAAGYGKAITDLLEIFRAAKEGRGDLLIVHNAFNQAVKMTGEFSFELVDDSASPNIIDDLAGEIAREVLSKKGRVVFTDRDEITALGEIVLKVRY
ncbi:MAG: hypothetical protein ACOYN4_06300 [Bacteroidales bacterium]